MYCKIFYILFVFLLCVTSYIYRSWKKVQETISATRFGALSGKKGHLYPVVEKEGRVFFCCRPKFRWRKIIYHVELEN